MSIGYIPKKLKYSRRRRRARKNLRRSRKQFESQIFTIDYTASRKKKPTFLERLKAFFR